MSVIVTNAYGLISLLLLKDKIVQTDEETKFSCMLNLRGTPKTKEFRKVESERKWK